MTRFDIDVLIFGGGAAGLWLLDELTRRGADSVLLEAGRLGSGQTVASQGIIHGGLKYSFSGIVSASARAISDMPDRWRRCLEGAAEPDLSATRLRSPHCYLWATRSVKSRLSLRAASAGLRVRPMRLDDDERPEVLRDCPGLVMRLDEQVIAPESFVKALADRNPHRLVRIDPDRLKVERRHAGPDVTSIVAAGPGDACTFEFHPRSVVLAAGEGNAALRRAMGLPDQAMQRRPLHMVVVRGALPRFCGHCTDGARTRVTITSDEDAQGRTVWQVGGQVSEDGVEMDQQALVRHARAELEATLPGVVGSDAAWSTYRVDRAEARTADGRRPEHAHVAQDGNVMTAWPTKLALVPDLVDRICGMLPALDGGGDPERQAIEIASDVVRPEVAPPPWECDLTWTHVD